MMASLLIVFREVLEAALVVSIVAAATVGVQGRAKWILGGIGAGIIGSLVVAGFANQIADAAEGVGQEIFNASVLFAAVFLLSWHNIWMARHGKEIAAQVGRVGGHVKEGAEPMYALAIVVGVAVLREGSEIVLFMYGIAASLNSGFADMAVGSAFGLAAGMALGFVLYFGLLKIPLRYFFSVTSWMILLLAAGMAANGANFLNQADILPALGYGIWDSSWLLSQESFLGEILHVLVGYSARPSGIQIVFYLLTILIVGGLMILTNKKANQDFAAKAAKKMAIFILALGLAIAFLSNQSEAGVLKVYSPIVEKGEMELEVFGVLEDDNTAGFKHEVGLGVTDRWFTSIYLETEKKPGGFYNGKFIATEHIFQLTGQGQYFIDVGVYLEYKVALDSGRPDKFEGKILLEKSTRHFTHTANIIFENEIGPGAAQGTDLEYAWQSLYRFKPSLQFGLQGFGKFGKIHDFLPGRMQRHQIGPAFRAKQRLGNKTFFVYEAGYMIGLTQGSKNVFRWLVELEIYF
ncbi:MAG: FTR1 family protein [Proteobacteria bacterium]|nr:FTR1 family protein [Pseudomonadota bacterium]